MYILFLLPNVTNLWIGTFVLCSLSAVSSHVVDMITKNLFITVVNIVIIVGNAQFNLK